LSFKRGEGACGFNGFGAGGSRPIIAVGAATSALVRSTFGVGQLHVSAILSQAALKMYPLRHTRSVSPTKPAFGLAFFGGLQLVSENRVLNLGLSQGSWEGRR
jgi:hypothetical protein